MDSDTAIQRYKSWDAMLVCMAAWPHRCIVVPMDQPALDRLALDAAYQQALKSKSEGGIPIGSALLTAQGVVVALGHNLRVQSGDSTAHAETVCIRNAGRRRDWHTLTLASTLDRKTVV